jgi:hypothetical protein
MTMETQSRSLLVCFVFAIACHKKIRQGQTVDIQGPVEDAWFELGQRADA